MEQQNTLHLVVNTPGSPMADEKVESVVIPALNGLLEAEFNHDSLIGALRPGCLELKKDGKVFLSYFVDKGFFSIWNNQVSVNAQVVESLNDIDSERAKKAEERALARLQAKSLDTDIVRALDSLERARARLVLLKQGSLSK